MCYGYVHFGRVVLLHFSHELSFWIVRGDVGLQSLSDEMSSQTVVTGFQLQLSLFGVCVCYS